MNFEGVYQVVVLAFATAIISTTIARAKVFSPFRRMVTSHSTWLGNLVSCFYCTAHWIGIGFVAIYRPVLIEKYPPIDIVVSAFATIAVAIIIAGVIIMLTFDNGVPSD
jgi:hypothetical protein